MEVTVLKTLGDPDDPRTEVEKILACAEVTEEFPGEVVRAAATCPPRCARTTARIGWTFATSRS